MIADYIVISTIFSVIFVPIYIYFLLIFGIYPVLVMSLIALISISKHIENLKRIAEGKELSFRKYLLKEKKIIKIKRAYALLFFYG